MPLFSNPRSKNSILLEHMHSKCYGSGFRDLPWVIVPLLELIDIYGEIPSVQRTTTMIFWVSERLLVMYHIITQSRIRKHADVESGMCSYQDHSVQRCISYITMLIASMIPILAIVVLFCVGSMKARLGLVALFTIIFTMSLTILTSAKKAEIFAATSTYVLLILSEFPQLVLNLS
jgi:branched-subunit amino acid transport protein AzlD